MKKRQSIKKLYGFYRGIVKKQLNNGYCLIEIPGVLQFDKDDNNLPPAEPAQSICGGGKANRGIFSYPDIGSTVWCFFANGDVRKPIYFAVSNANSNEWINVSQKLNKDQDLPGYSNATTIHSTGIETVFDKSVISQTIMLNPGGNGDDTDALTTIDIRVGSLNEDLNRSVKQNVNDDGYNKGVENNYSQVNNGSIIKNGGEIIITNSFGGQVHICGATAVKIRAPKIELDTTNTGAPGNGEITLKSGKINLSTTDGNIEMNNSNIAINVQNKKYFCVNGDKDVILA